VNNEAYIVDIVITAQISLLTILNHDVMHPGW